MTAFAALLRAVNVGGTGKLAMSDLRELCEQLGFDDVHTYIQSGNVVFRSDLGEPEIRHRLEGAMEHQLGKPVAVAVRSAYDLARIVELSPFLDKDGAKVTVALGPERLAATAADDIRIPGTEQVAVVGGELYVYYPEGMGRSKLVLPKSLGPFTVRNLNTITKLSELANELT